MPRDTCTVMIGAMERGAFDALRDAGSCYTVVAGRSPAVRSGGLTWMSGRFSRGVRDARIDTTPDIL